MRDFNRRSALIGSASLALGLGATSAFAQSQGLAQAAANVIAASRAEYEKLLAQTDARFVGLPSPSAPRSEVGGHPCQGLYWTPKGQRPRVALIATHYNVDFAEHYLAPYIASRGYGFAWLPEYKIQSELEAGTLKALPMRDGQERRVQLYLVFADREGAGPGALRLAEILREESAKTCRELGHDPDQKQLAKVI